VNLKQSFVTTPGHARALSVHLLRTDHNEHVEVLDCRGVTQREDLRATLQSMFRTRSATQSDKGLFQVSINPEADRAAAMDGKAWAQCLDAIEQEFNLAGQPRVLVAHVKNGRHHLHAVYQTADVERGRQCDDFGHNYRRGARVARQLEKELGHAVQPDRSERGGSYTQGENERAKREGASAEQWRQDVREAWKQTTTASELRAQLQAKGYDVAEGNGGRVCFMSPEGKPVAMGTLLKGLASAADAKARFAGQRLESVEVVAERQLDRATAPERPSETTGQKKGRSLAQSIEAAQRQRAERTAARFAETRDEATATDATARLAAQFAQSRDDATKRQEPPTRKEDDVTITPPDEPITPTATEPTDEERPHLDEPPPDREINPWDEPPARNPPPTYAAPQPRTLDQVQESIQQTRARLEALSPLNNPISREDDPEAFEERKAEYLREMEALRQLRQQDRDRSRGYDR
jgi:hypothetical protein